MARLLQGLILWVPALAVMAAPFHRVHLKLKLECAACHPAAATSTNAQDNLLPAREACLKCHGNAQAAAAPNHQLAHFNHQLHLKFGSLAPVFAKAIDSGAYLGRPGEIRRHLSTSNPCEACHRGLWESDAVAAANMPAMADCLVCHNRIDPPFSCEKCHSNQMKLKPVSHTPDFIDTHTSGRLALDKSTCAVCHGRNFTCQGCH